MKTVQWVAVADGNPDTERSVLVFLCGDRGLMDDRPADAGWGERLGWFDHDRWFVGGMRENYVTHWMDLPDPPATTGVRPSAVPDAGSDEAE